MVLITGFAAGVLGRRWQGVRRWFRAAAQNGEPGDEDARAGARAPQMTVSQTDDLLERVLESLDKMNE